MEEKYVITIGRQLGSGGKKIGEYLSQKFGIPCYDKELIQIASEKSGLGKEFFEKMDEKSKYRLFSGFFSFRSGYMAGDLSGSYLSNEKLFNIQSEVIRSIAEKESCIFVGRCADYILREHPRLISVFVSAEMEDRVQRLVKEENFSEKDIITTIEQGDKQRSEYYNYFSNKTWGMASSYHLCVDSSVLGLEKTGQFIENYIREFLSE